MKNIKTINFSEGKTLANLTALFIPLLIAFFFNMAFDINDSLWIGNLLGENALAAQTVSMPIMLLYNAICMGSTGGIAIILSKYIGSKSHEKIERLITTSFFVFIVFSLIITVACEFGIDGILYALQTPKSIYSMARKFLFIHIFSFPFTMLYIYFSAILRSYGNSILQLITIVICTLLNVILDPLFIHFMGLPGVALATVLSEAVLMVWVFVYCVKRRVFKINFKKFSKESFKEIFTNSVPSMIQQSLPSISTFFITSLVAGFGVLSLAGFGVAGRIEIFLLYPPMALNMALTTATGQCFGSKLHNKARDYLKCGLSVGCILLFVLTLLVTIFSKNLAFLFGTDQYISNIVMGYYLVICAGYICNAVTNSFLGTINGFGKPTTAMLIMIFYYIIVRMPLSKVLSVTTLGLHGIWFAILISHVAAALASILYYQISLKKMVN